MPLLARQAADVCAIEMLQQLTRQETEERLGASLLEQLLDPNQPERRGGGGKVRSPGIPAGR
jgi:hypothetical protein